MFRFDALWKYQKTIGFSRLVFSRFLIFAEISEMLKKGFSSFLSFTDWKNPTILV